MPYSKKARAAAGAELSRRRGKGKKGKKRPMKKVKTRTLRHIASDGRTY